MIRLKPIILSLLALLLSTMAEAQEYPDLSTLRFTGIEAKVIKYKTQWSAGVMIAYQPGPVDQHNFIGLEGSRILDYIFETPSLLEQLQERAGGYFATEMPPTLNWERESSTFYIAQIEQRLSPKWALVQQYGVIMSSAKSDFELTFQDFEDLSAPPFDITAESVIDINGWQAGVGVRRYFRGIIEPFLQLMPFYRSIKADEAMVDVVNLSFLPESREFKTSVYGVLLQLGLRIPVSETVQVDVFSGIAYEKEENGDPQTPIHIGTGIFLIF